MNKETIISALLAVALTGSAILALALLSAEFFEIYGFGIFILTPVAGGLVSVLIFNRRGKKRLGESLKVSALAAGFSLLGFFIVGFEGAICLVMSIPVVFPLFICGGLVGFSLSRAIGQRFARDLCVLLVISFIPFFLGFESQYSHNQRPRKVSTKVIISGDLETVWKEVVEFSPIAEPSEFIFKMGIAYPTHAEIKGYGVGATRFCYFSTGAFVEPITHWEVNKRLAFDVSEQPMPMTEISPYVGIHPPHLDWAVKSQKGEFFLNDLGDGRVELTGSTWFKTSMQPEPYWAWLSEIMIQQIHLRVLDHIQASVEEGVQR